MTNYSDSVKEGIISEFDKGGHTAKSLSDMYEIPYATVYRWIKISGRSLDRCAYDSRDAKIATPHLAEVNSQLYALIQTENQACYRPNAVKNTDDVVLQLKKIEAALNKLTYAIYAVAYKDELEKIPEEL